MKETIQRIWKDISHGKKLRQLFTDKYIHTITGAEFAGNRIPRVDYSIISTSARYSRCKRSVKRVVITRNPTRCETLTGPYAQAMD